MGFISCISFPTLNCRILSSHHFTKQLVSAASYSLKFALRREEDKPNFSLFLPSTSSLMATPIQASSTSTIGVLGPLVAEQWRKEHLECQIFGQTVTKNHHDELEKLGIKPSLKETEFEVMFSYVIFCAPPSQRADYAAEVSSASESQKCGPCCSPYDCFDNGDCNEDSPVVPLGKCPRTDVLLKAKKIMLECGGLSLDWQGFTQRL